MSQNVDPSLHYYISYLKNRGNIQLMSNTFYKKLDRRINFFCLCNFQCANYGIYLVQKGHLKIYKT